MSKIMLENVRLAFPALWTPRAMVGNDGKPGDPAYSATALFARDSAAHKAVERAIREAAKEKWHERAADVLKELAAAGKICLRSGDAKASYDGFAGNLFVQARCKNPAPFIVDRDGRRVLTERDGRPYGGCYVNMLVEVWAQANQFGKRINASLKGVMFVADGDAFGGGAPGTADDFAPYAKDDAEGGGLSQGAADDMPFDIA